ncbi:MAG: transglutaminase family protein [Planctomycetota bacterium]
MTQPTSPDALVSLLQDDTPATRTAVRRALARLGDRAVPALERAMDDGEPRLRARARQALLELRADRGLERLEALLKTPETPLEEGLFAIDDLLGAEGVADARRRFDAWGAALSDALPTGSGPTDAADALRRLLGAEAGFVGPERDFHNVDHVSLGRTVASRRGLPLTLCAVYQSVARRAGVAAALVPFPGQVLLIVGDEAEQRRILDPFSGGTEISEAACLARLCAMGAPPSHEWLRPAADRAMLVRQVRNLRAAMERHGRSRDAARLARLIDEA